MMLTLEQGLSLLGELPSRAAAVPENEALAQYLSDYVLRFVLGPEAPVSPPDGQPDFWLFLPFATAKDYPNCSSEQVRELALASTYMIIYNILFDAVVDDPNQPDITTQVLAEAALAVLYERLYSLFPAGSPFWDYYPHLYHRFLAAMIEEKTWHKGRLQPYAYADYARLARDKMSMVLLNPVGQTVLNGTTDSIPAMLAAWDELNTAVVILDDIKDWGEDFQQGNFTYLLAQALQINELDCPLPDGETLVTRVIFSGAMEALYRQGAAHLDKAAELALVAGAPALAGLAEERAKMFHRFSRHLLQRKLTNLHNTLIGQVSFQGSDVGGIE